jgi:hypothetical protein
MSLRKGLMQAPDPIPLPDYQRPDRMPSFPAWLASRVASINDVVQPDQITGKHRLAPTLPRSLTLNDAERSTIEDHVLKLEAACSRTPAREPEAEGELVLMLTDMQLALLAAKQNEAGVEARGEAYLAALDDVPPWAVQAAIHAWYRGEAGNDERGRPWDYNWPPSPAALRRVAVGKLCRVTTRADSLRKLLRAEPLVDYSEEHRQEMLQRLSKLTRETFGISLVGKDGSSKTVGVAPAEGVNCGTEPRHNPA